MREQPHPEDRGALLPQGALHLSHGASISLSSHHFWKLLIPLEGQVGVSLPDGRRWVSPHVMLVRAHLLHQAWSTGPCLALLQEITSLDGMRCESLEQERAGVTILGPSVSARLRDIARQGKTDLGAAVADELRLCVKDLWATRSLDPRVAEVQSMLCHGESSVEKLAASVKLSRGHLAHLFKQEMGLTMPRYLLWRRTVQAMTFVLQGQGLAAAAYDAGFADQAHFSRSFRRLMGRSPSALVVPDRKMVQDLR